MRGLKGLMTSERWFIVALVAVIGTLLLGATAIDKRDEQSCKNRYARTYEELPPKSS
jgi:hypothetical protein